MTALALVSPDGHAAGPAAGFAAPGNVASTAVTSLAAMPRYKGFELRVDDTLAGPQREFTFERIKPSALEFVSEFRGVKRGIGVDWGLVDSGNLHFNLYSGKDGFAHGKRWSVDERDEDTGSGSPVVHGGRYWSIGASLDLVRFRSVDADGARDSRVVVSPQFLLDVGTLTGVCGRCELLVQDTMWRGADARAADPQRVVQVSMKWRF